jgi:hypothetical protein
VARYLIDVNLPSRAMLAPPPPPRVIHVRLGNLRMREFHRRMTAVWPDACALSEEYRLVSIFEDHLEGIGGPAER